VTTISPDNLQEMGERGEEAGSLYIEYGTKHLERKKSVTKMS
jgi:hypothetical protein